MQVRLLQFQRRCRPRCELESRNSIRATPGQAAIDLSRSKSTLCLLILGNLLELLVGNEWIVSRVSPCKSNCNRTEIKSKQMIGVINAEQEARRRKHNTDSHFTFSY